jgi:FixJ family two-component response regulator
MISAKSVIAIVDDDASICRAVKRLLRSAGMEANTFTSGQQFLEYMATVPWVRVQCVVLDVHMPGMNGLETQGRLLQNSDCPPIIFISAEENPQAREEALAAGAVAFLCKPVSDNVLIEALEAAMKPSDRGVET